MLDIDNVTQIRIRAFARTIHPMWLVGNHKQLFTGTTNIQIRPRTPSV